MLGIGSRDWQSIYTGTGAMDGHAPHAANTTSIGRCSKGSSTGGGGGGVTTLTIKVPIDLTVIR